MRNIKTNEIEINFPTIPSSHIFELSSNNSQILNRDILYGFVDGTSLSSAIPSAILVQTSYEEMEQKRIFNFYESNSKTYDQQITKEPIFRSYLLTPSFNRSYPYIRVLIATVQGSYESMNIEPLCAIVTAVNELNLYEIESCFISPNTGYCLVTISVVKMLEYVNTNQTKNKIELYSKIYHVRSYNECLSDHTLKQDHVHHDARIGHVEPNDNENILFSTVRHLFIAIDYPNGIHYTNWYFPLKLKLIHSSFELTSFILRCHLTSIFSIHNIQTNILKITSHSIQINYYIHKQESVSYIDFNIIIENLAENKSNQNYEFDLATIMLKINSTNFYKLDKLDLNSVYFIDWFLIKNNTINYKDSIVKVPINIRYDDIQNIVGLTDFTNLINTAILTMQSQQYSLKILSVNYSGSIETISEAVCHSENIYLIQVDPNCKHIYFSGHERDEFFDDISSPTSVLIRYGKYLQRIVFTIYIPERPLRIELSDTKLSRINGWFITKREYDKDRSHSLTYNFDNVENENEIENDIDHDDDDDDMKCYPVYQQSYINVYTKFYRTTSNGDRIYLFNKFNVRVTSLVRGHLETDNKRVAIVKNGRAIGVGPGKTNIRIYSFTNKIPMGSKTIYVDDQELIRIENISFNILTNIDLQTNLIEHIDSIYKIHFRIRPLFNLFKIEYPNQFGQVNILLTYSDNTSVSLDDISSSNYQLDIDTTRTNPSLIRFNSSKFWTNLHIYPLSAGQTSIYSRLKLGEQQCTDDKFSFQYDLTCQINILTNNNYQLSKNSDKLSIRQENEHYIILNNNQNNINNNNNETKTKTSPFLIALFIFLGACLVLLCAFILHWIIHYYNRHKSMKSSRRQRHSTQSGAEEANQDWIFLDRNSLEIPIKQQQEQQCSPSIHDSTLHITSNPLINTSTLQRQGELTELSHSQMIAYFDNLKESHA